MLMVALIRGIFINLPGIMVSQMKEVATSRRLCLSYGMGLTRIFRAFSVSLEVEAFKEILHMDTYHNKSLHQIGYKKIDGRWTCRGSGQEMELDFEEEITIAEAGPLELADGTAIEVGQSGLEEGPQS